MLKQCVLMGKHVSEIIENVGNDNSLEDYNVGDDNHNDHVLSVSFFEPGNYDKNEIMGEPIS